MAIQLKITQVGNSLGVILPKELLAQLKVGKGDVLSVVNTPEGIQIRAYEEEFEHTMAIARDVMRKRRAVLRELAK